MALTQVEAVTITGIPDGFGVLPYAVLQTLMEDRNQKKGEVT